MTAQEAADAIKQRVTMRQCAEAYGFKPNRAGFIRCPFRSEKTPSLKCYDGTRGFSCYGCGEYGSVIDFVKKLYGLDFWQAVARMDMDFGLCLPLRTRLTARECRAEAEARRRAADERERRRQAADDAEAEYLLRLAWWGALEQIYEQFRPREPGGEWDELFVFAAKQRTVAHEDMEQADIKRMQYERERHSGTGMDSRGLSDNRAV